MTDIPKSLKTAVVFDQSLFVKKAIDNLLHEGGIGIVLTAVMILLFLGSVRATIAVMLSIPLSALAAFMAIFAPTTLLIRTMVLGGLALAFSRLIDNSVVVLENIFRHLEMGEDPATAAELGGKEVAMPVLAATFTTMIVFFPGHVAERRQSIPLHRASGSCSAVSQRLIHRGDDWRTRCIAQS